MSATQKTDVQVGNRYGDLTVTALRRKPRNSGQTEAQAECLCICGKISWYACSRLRHGKSTRCSSCSAKATHFRGTRVPMHEQWLCRKERHYRKDARSNKRQFTLVREQFREIFTGTCIYCGEFPAFGIDRKNNTSGYTLENSAPCCPTCNYAKRDMSVDEFISWAKRVYSFRGWKK